MSKSTNEVDSPLDPPTESLFSNLVTVISGARQTANQEFSRIWDKFTHHNQSTGLAHTWLANDMPRQRSFNTTKFGSQGDLARIEAGQTIHGRLVPDTHRRVGYMRDAEIQTENFIQGDSLDGLGFSVKRKASSLVEDQEEEKEKERPNKMMKSDTISTSSTPVVHNVATVRSPIQSSPIRSTIQQSFSPVRSSPESNNHIRTGSVKSVKRLTFELEEAFSPRFPTPVGQPLGYSIPFKTKDNSDPFSSTDIVNDIASVSEKEDSPVHEKNDKQEETPQKELESCYVSPKEHHIPLGSPYRTTSSRAVMKATGISPQSPKRRMDREEEDRRLEELQQKVNSIKSQVNSYVSYPPSIRSPRPSHTVTSETIEDTMTTTSSPLHSSPIRESKQVFSPVRVSSPTTSTPVRASTVATSPIRPIVSTPLRVSNVTTSPVRPNVSTPVRASISPHAYYQRSSPKHTNYIPTPPPAPPPMNELPKTFLPSRDIPNALLSMRLASSASRPHPKSIHESQLAPFLGPNIAINDRTPLLKPTVEHKSSMRELIQLIPGVQLRKTDKLIGPDGKERPNPFWNEIYNRNGRRVY